MPRFHTPSPLPPGALIELPDRAARHVQVLRLQPGNRITLFNGEGGECEATVTRMGRSEVQVRIERYLPLERETAREVHLAMGMPANERMDWLVEKATELGVNAVQPLLTERSVLRLAGERADKKRVHWQGIAIAACEQCGRNRVPMVHPVATLAAWLNTAATATRLLLSLEPDSRPLTSLIPSIPSGPVVFLSGPEGGLSQAEEDAARQHGFVPVSLGARTLRAETAPLAALAALTLLA
jgi:16S rRNA (uracil1498-N3)-methyltransferase